MKCFILGLIIMLLYTTSVSVAFGVPNQNNLPSESFIIGNSHGQTAGTHGITAFASDIDIIHPQTGQFANYSHSLYYSNETIGWSGWWNMSYNEYIQPHIINTTQVIDDRCLQMELTGAQSTPQPDG